MDIEFDAAKRDMILADRGLDLSRAREVFAGVHANILDTRFDYGEDRFITAGYLDGRFVMLIWTPRGAARRIISLRHGHEKEHRRWQNRLG